MRLRPCLRSYIDCRVKDISSPNRGVGLEQAPIAGSDRLSRRRRGASARHAPEHRIRRPLRRLCGARCGCASGPSDRRTGWRAARAATVSTARWCGSTRSRRDTGVHPLDALLREVAEAGVFVSTHPDVIMKLGTKDVLVDTREMGWGSDVHRLDTQEQLRSELGQRLAAGSTESSSSGAGIAARASGECKPCQAPRRSTHGALCSQGMHSEEAPRSR